MVKNGSSKRHPVSAEWRKLLKCLPGYDPFLQADGYYFDAEAAQLRIDFIEACVHHVEGELAGEPLILERWQKSLIANLFGWKSKNTGLRQYREAFVFLPRKNGKTTVAASMVEVLIFLDSEPGAQIYSAAAERKQAALCFGIVKRQIGMEPALAGRCQAFAKTITVEAEGISYEPISAEAHSKHGYNPHAVVSDELHAQPNRELIDVLESGMGARRQPLMIHITTAGYDRNSICYEKYEAACAVRDNKGDPDDPGYDPALLPVIYEAEKDDDWRDEKTWAKANPNLGVSVKLEFLQRECAKALSNPALENRFRRLYLNQWTEQDVRWLPMHHWDECEPLDVLSLAGRECWGGLDLGSTRDTTSFVLVFPDEDGEGYSVLVWCFIPEEGAKQREQRDRVPYRNWVNAGHVLTTPGEACEYAWVRNKIVELAGIYEIQDIGFDAWNATETADELASAEGLVMVKMPQGTRTMHEPSKLLERLVINRQLRHGNNPLLRWMASNVAVRFDVNGNYMPTKAHTERNRIDAIVALIMALGRAMVGVNDRSVYEDRGLLTL